MRIIVLFILCVVNIMAQKTVDEVLDLAEKNEETRSTKSIVEQIVTAPDGRRSVSRLISYGKDEGDKGLMVYVEPARVKDMKILTLNEGDDIWFASPRTGRVRKIASHNRKQAVNGSDFSYEDLSTKDRREDYVCVIQGIERRRGADCYKIEMIAKENDEIYQKIITWVDSSLYVVREIEFYDEDGELWKRLYAGDIKTIEDYHIASRLEMKDVQKGSVTVMKMDSIQVDIPVEDDLFSERNLKR